MLKEERDVKGIEERDNKRMRVGDFGGWDVIDKEDEENESELVKMILWIRVVVVKVVVLLIFNMFMFMVWKGNCKVIIKKIKILGKKIFVLV